MNFWLQFDEYPISRPWNPNNDEYEGHYAVRNNAYRQPVIQVW